MVELSSFAKEHGLEVLLGLGEVAAARIVGEPLGGVDGFYLLLEEVLLVEEEDHRRIREPLRVADLLKELHRLEQPILRVVLIEHLVVL